MHFWEGENSHTWEMEKNSVGSGDSLSLGHGSVHCINWALAGRQAFWKEEEMGGEEPGGPGGGQKMEAFYPCSPLWKTGRWRILFCLCSDPSVGR